MLLKIKALSALLLISFHIFAVVLFLILFQLNRQYIAENLCKNRIYKSNTCQGQCYFQETLSLLEGENSVDQIDFLVILDNYLVPEEAGIYEPSNPFLISGYPDRSHQFLYRSIHSGVDLPPPESRGI